MGFFNKKDGKKTGIPELPELPNLSETMKLPSDDEFEISGQNTFEPSSSLPSYPNSSFGERINQSAIKDAVTYGEPEIRQKKQRTPSISPAIPIQQNQAKNNRPKNLEVDGQTFEPSIGQRGIKRTVEVPDYEVQTFPTSPFSNRMQENQNRMRQTGPLFIQLDKFEESIATLDEVKIQVSEIESLLRSIQEVKNKEDEKLIFWQRQIESIKARLDKVDRDLFENV